MPVSYRDLPKYEHLNDSPQCIEFVSYSVNQWTVLAARNKGAYRVFQQEHI